MVPSTLRSKPVSEQDRLLRAIEEHQAANRTYLDEGIRLLELARRAHALFMRQEAREKLLQTENFYAGIWVDTRSWLAHTHPRFMNGATWQSA